VVESSQSSRLVGVWDHWMIEKGAGLDTRRWQRRAGFEAHAPYGDSSSMEGTSGAAERALLRGGAREAALSAGTWKRSPPGGLGETLRGSPSAQATPAYVETSLRQEVSEPIRLGTSFRCERSRRKDAGHSSCLSGLWPVKPRLAVLRKGPGHLPESGLWGRPWGLCAGLGGSRGLCSRIANDCRSWQAALGPRDHRWWACVIAQYLAPPCESIRGAKGRRKPATRWQNRENGGGLLSVKAGA